VDLPPPALSRPPDTRLVAVPAGSPARVPETPRGSRSVEGSLPRRDRSHCASEPHNGRTPPNVGSEQPILAPRGAFQETGAVRVLLVKRSGGRGTHIPLLAVLAEGAWRALARQTTERSATRELSA